MPEANTPRDKKRSPQRMEMTAKKMHTGIVVLAARPSTPSVRFTELTVPTMTKAAKMTYSGSEIGTVLFQNGMYRLSSAT